jgi:hypothetical protein
VAKQMSKAGLIQAIAEEHADKLTQKDVKGVLESEAGAQTDQKLKEALFELQRHWQFLARSYDPATVLSCWTASKIWRSVNYEAEAG